jgi:uncharacterized protein (DUF2141 family)
MVLLKQFFLISLFMGWQPWLYTQSTATVTLKIVGVKNNVGSVRAALFNNEKDFLKNAMYGEIVNANSDTVVIVFHAIPYGDYGISIMHDENKNGTLDTNFVGIPKEGFGFGNDSLGAFGPPSFEKANVSIYAKEVIHTMRMRYF